MRLPDWVPEVPRPFNSDWAETWDVMTPNERRWSFIFDATVVAAVVALWWTFS